MNGRKPKTASSEKTIGLACERDRRDDRDRELRDLRAELADRLTGPEPDEVRVVPEPACRAAQPTHRALGGRAWRRGRRACRWDRSRP